MLGRSRRRADRRQPHARASRVEEDARAPAAHGLIVRAVAAALPLVFVACAASQDPRTDPSRLEGIVWVLDAASTGSLVDDVPHGAQVDLRFQDGQAQGRSGCNNYGGGYEADDGALSFEPFAVTEMACDGPVMAVESAYLGALSNVSGYQISDAGLALTGGDVALTFTPGASTTAA